MLARAKPGEAYRQSNFDVRLMASDRDDLVLICLDDLIENLGVLEIVEQRDDRAAQRFGQLLAMVEPPHAARSRVTKL